MKIIFIVAVLVHYHSAVNGQEEEIDACRKLALDITDQNKVPAGVRIMIIIFFFLIFKCVNIH